MTPSEQALVSKHLVYLRRKRAGHKGNGTTYNYPGTANITKADELTSLISALEGILHEQIPANRAADL